MFKKFKILFQIILLFNEIKKSKNFYFSFLRK
jgi:hypothetical protein